MIDGWDQPLIASCSTLYMCRRTLGGRAPPTHIGRLTLSLDMALKLNLDLRGRVGSVSATGILLSYRQGSSTYSRLLVA